jgi:hypothetical protein
MSCKQERVVYDKSCIRLDKQLQTDITAKISTFADSISYIFLETSDDCLLPALSSLVYMDDQVIFVRGGNHVYQFTSEGFFKNKIGKVGGGPEEYPQLLDVTIDDESKYIIILTANSTVFMYDYQGNFVKKINLPKDIRSIIYFRNNSFLCITNEYSDQVSSYLIAYNYDGNELTKKSIGNESHSFERTLQSVPILYKWEEIKIKFPYSNV